METCLISARDVPHPFKKPDHRKTIAVGASGELPLWFLQIADTEFPGEGGRDLRIGFWK